MSSGRSDFVGGNNQDNGWMGWVFVLTILLAALEIAGLRLLALK